MNISWCNSISVVVKDSIHNAVLYYVKCNGLHSVHSPRIQGEAQNFLRTASRGGGLNTV